MRRGAHRHARAPVPATVGARPLAALGCMPGRAGGNRAGLTAPCARGAWACAHSGLRQQPPAGACPRQRLPRCICEGWLAVLPYRCRKSVWVNVSGSGPQSVVWPTGGRGAFFGNGGSCQPCGSKAGARRWVLDAAWGLWLAQPANNHTLHVKDSMPRALAGTWARSTSLMVSGRCSRF